MNAIIKTIQRPALLSIGFSIATSSVWAQAVTNTPTPASPYTSVTFYALFFVAVILLIFILQLGKVLSTVAKNYKRGDKSLWDRSLMILVLFGISSMFPSLSWAADTSAPTNPGPILDFLHHGFGSNAINALAVIIFFELIVVIYLIRLIRMFTAKEQEFPSALSAKKASLTSPMWDKLNASVAINEEQAIMTDHEYDGIRELDNALPPWWKYGFYLTIIWAFGYMLYYHISSGPSSEQEYISQMTQAAIDIAEYRKMAKNLVDETNVTILNDGSDIKAGAAIFSQYCAVCHGPDGGGIVGPNLTDNYWLHGSDIKNLFTTIKYGVQGKGMKSWQQELSPVMMAQVASFITTLRGTSPASPKAPEGKLDEKAAPAASDSTDADSLSIENVK